MTDLYDETYTRPALPKVIPEELERYFAAVKAENDRLRREHRAMSNGAQTNARVVKLQAEKIAQMQEKIDELESTIAQLDEALFQKEKKLDTVEAARAMLQAELSDNANLRRLLARYRDETPLRHQPHMIAHQADEALCRVPPVMAQDAAMEAKQ